MYEFYELLIEHRGLIQYFFAFITAIIVVVAFGNTVLSFQERANRKRRTYCGTAKF